MTGLFSRIGALFGGARQGQDGGRRDEETVVYKDLRICPAPIPEGGQWRLAAAIVKGTGDDAVEYDLVRADVFSSRDDAMNFAVRKAKQVIDEQGERLFTGQGTS